MENNEAFFELISNIKNISLNHSDLMDIGLEYSKSYFKDKKEEEEFDIFFANNTFNEQFVMAARDGLILGMHAITLNQDINFEQIVLHCIDLKQQRINESIITTEPETIAKLKEFLSFLRKEIFSRTYSKNKELQKVTNIPKAILQERYNYFMGQPF
jgi:hypothetical protein